MSVFSSYTSIAFVIDVTPSLLTSLICLLFNEIIVPVFDIWLLFSPAPGSGFLPKVRLRLPAPGSHIYKFLLRTPALASATSKKPRLPASISYLPLLKGFLPAPAPGFINLFYRLPQKRLRLTETDCNTLLQIKKEAKSDMWKSDIIDRH